MIHFAPRLRPLLVLVLLLSGLLQTAASAQRVTCARAQGDALPAAQVVADASASVDHPQLVAVPHDHAPAPGADVPAVPSAPCGVTAVPAERIAPPPHDSVARHRLSPGALPPARLFIGSLFRPPRLS